MIGTAIAGIGTGLVVRLVGSGVQRAGSLVFQKAMRVVKIESALKGIVTKNPNVQKAIDDFETVIGSRYGALNSELFSFLREIERSGIVNSMVENALLERDAGELKNVFSEIHSKFIGSGRGASEELFEQMMKSFFVTLQELSQDRILLGAIRAHRSEMVARLERVDFALQQIQSKKSGKDHSFDTLRATLLKIAKGLQGLYRSIRVETNKGARSVDITRIYIPPKLKYRAGPVNLHRTLSGVSA
jgi:hypothetical protein